MTKNLLPALAVMCASTALGQPDDARRSGAARAGDGDGVAVTAAATARTLSFSGYTWNVKASGGAAWGPGSNVYSDAARNVWVDEAGRLHLKITQEAGVWTCAEVILQNSLGYGSYRYTLDTPLDDLDPNVVLGLFTWNDDPAFNHREIDIEFSRWGNPLDAANAQYTVQPYTASANLLRWTLPPGYTSSSHSFRWSSRSVAFLSSSAGNPLRQWSYTRRAGIPKPGGENARINLWLFQGAAPRNALPVEVIISKFEFLP